MKLLYVIGSMEVGGAEQHLLRVSSELRQRGFKPAVFAITTGGPLTQAFVEANVPVHGIKLPAWIRKILPSERARVRVELVYASLALWCLYWRMRPQVVHFFLPAAYIVGGITSLAAPRARRIMSRRSLNHYQAKHLTLSRLEHWLHTKMDAVCGNSKAVVRDLEGEGVRSEQLRLIYNGLNLQRFARTRTRSQVRAELGIADGALVFTIVANLIPYKGHSDLIEAFGMIRQALPQDWHCLFIGRDDGIGASLKQQAESLGIGERIHLLGSRKDVPDLLNAADIGILASHEEGFSNAILEGMAARLPMVVTDVGGNAEAVLHEVTGLVVPARAPRELSQALLAVASNPERNLMGEAGFHRIETVFSMEACLQGYADLYVAPAIPEISLKKIK